jgi:hypothetical protein
MVLRMCSPAFQRFAVSAVESKPASDDFAADKFGWHLVKEHKVRLLRLEMPGILAYPSGSGGDDLAPSKALYLASVIQCDRITVVRSRRYVAEFVPQMSWC